MQEARERSIPAIALAWLAAPLLATAAATAQEFPFRADTTFFIPLEIGHCSFSAIPSDASPSLRVAALGTPLYAGSEPCGRFIEIDTTGASCVAPPCDFTGERVVAMVSDELVSTEPDLDLSESAFAAIAHVDEGVLLNVRWRYVEGTHEGAVELRTTPGINPNFIHFVLEKHNLGITTVSVRDAVDPTWHPAVRDLANQWSVSTGQAFLPPLSVRITDVAGRRVTAFDAVDSLTPSVTHDLGVQLGAPTVASMGDLARALGTLTMAVIGGWILRRRASSTKNEGI